MKKRIVALFLGLTMVGGALCGCKGASEDHGSKGDNGLNERKANGEIVAAIAQDLEDSLDPHSSTSAGTREVLFNVYEGLVKTGPDGELIPAVADDYDISADGLTYTFHLRKGVKFHNGAAVTAEDVIYSLKRCADNSGDSALVSAFSAIRDIAAPDAETVTFRLEKPNLELIYFMTAAIVPQNSDTLATRPCGTGPFRYVSRSPQENIILERFDDYWGAKAQLKKVTYKIYENPTALMMALKGGTVDLCAHLTAAQTAELDDSFRILSDTMNLVQAVYLNNSAAPFNNEKVRQALAYAIDRQAIMDFVADGHGVAVGSSIYPKLTKYFLPELAGKYPYDPATAKKLLTEAGYDFNTTIKIAVVSSYQPHMDTAEVVVNQLNAIGVKAEVQPMDNATWLKEVYTGRNFQATITGLDAKNVTARAMLERFVSTNGKNFVNYNNPAYDELYARAQSCDDDAAQTKLYQEMETMLADTAANLYLQDLADLVAIRKDLTGLRFYPIYAQDLSTLAYQG